MSKFFYTFLLSLVCSCAPIHTYYSTESNDKFLNDKIVSEIDTIKSGRENVYIYYYNYPVELKKYKRAQ